MQLRPPVTAGRSRLPRTSWRNGRGAAPGGGERCWSRPNTASHLAAASARGVEDKAKADGAGRRADRAAARPRIADEVGHVRAMAPLDEADPAIDRWWRRPAQRIQSRAHKAGAGPFPDIACHIEQAVFIGPESADRLRRLVEHRLAARLRPGSRPESRSASRPGSRPALRSASLS